MCPAYEYRPLLPEERPQDPHLDGRDLTFETLEHGGEFSDAMPQVIRMTDPAGRSAVYVPLRVDGKIVDGDGLRKRRPPS